ncbi:hypothetical protein [Paenibacillus physcomitrellae]|uniref:Uncharacterized protein n=1 Tax=Paenibacillus physcomitrellae TaxID=1619311 RepID=A0ABQ1GVC6_9BACL|nr:hypothetical protein [Paenibacillus physcomitrellae]GGA50653.1 hypothetical protein GCM10010917_39910 [Paenibacillus physcomitrellae]
MVVINGMAGTKDLVCTENTDNMKAADDEQTSKPEILRETAHFWSHVKMNEAGIEQPWFQRLNEHRKRR